MESRNCKWKKVDDLSKTRIRDPARGQVLVFKHIEWQTLRFVAKSELQTAVGQAPLRLIANQASCRITLKKRLSDCAPLGARIMLLFDDLLWVLFDSQLLSALHFADYLGNLIKRAPSTKKFENGDLKNSQPKTKMYPPANTSSPTRRANQSAYMSSISLFFAQYDFLETSHHIFVHRLEIHLMDDTGPQSQKSHCPELAEGGALQMTFLRLLIDLYPYQNVSGSRKHWLRYSEPSPNRQSFIDHKLKTFFLKQQANLKSEGSNFQLQSIYSHLLSRVFVIRLADYSISCVSTNTSNNRHKNDQLKLISFDQSTAIPGNVSPIYVEFNSYFYLEPLDELGFPVPDPTVFAYIAPMRIHFEPLTILWINAFFASLQNALIKLQEMFPTSDSSQDKMNVRAEILMPTLVFSSSPDSEDPYSTMEVKISRILLYNCDSFIKADYFKNLDHLMKELSVNLEFFYERTEYPWLSCDQKPISTEFIHKISRLFASSNNRTTEALVDNFDVDFLIVQLEPIWIEFRSRGTNSVEAFLEPINVNLWIDKSATATDENVDLNILARILDPISVQMNHDQLLFVLRLLERMGEFTTMLNYDTYMIQRNHFKREFEQQEVYSFDLEERIVKAIFKRAAFVTSIPEVNLYLILKQEAQSVSLPSPPVLEQKSSPEAKDDPDSLNPFNEDLTLEEVAKMVDGDSGLGSTVVKVEGGNPFEPEVESFQPAHQRMMATSVSEENLKQMAAKQNSVKKTFLPNNSASFDSINFKIHYSANDNEDALSTFSDVSGDENHSYIAMFNEGSDALDELFPTDKVEVAVELTEDFKFNEDEDTLNEEWRVANQVETLLTVLHARVEAVNVIQQSSRGFLSQVFVKTKLASVDELTELPRSELNQLLKKPLGEENSSNQLLTIRIDSFNKGTLKDELISVFVQNVEQTLNKDTIDLVVDFFTDKFADKVAPTAILVENLKFKLVDDSVRIPPMLFQVPKLKLARNKENKWIVESDLLLPKGKILDFSNY